MGRRDVLITKSILLAIFDDRRDDRKKTLLSRTLAFFTFFQLTLSRYKDELFKQLRTEVWKIDEDDYRESFRRRDKKATLKPVGDLGYSGSTFFTTPNGKYLIKSLPRPSEHNFFKHDLLQPYAEHMRSHPNSLLVRITDFLHAPYTTLGSLLGLAPSHHIVMENILYKGDSSSPAAAADADAHWETYDLKPPDYFYPERDLAGGALAPDSVKQRLLDTFPDKVRVSAAQRAELLSALRADTALLRAANVVDYSLFLVRYPAPSDAGGVVARTLDLLAAPVLARRATQWRTGVRSADGKWLYRAVVLDFFWAKHTLQAKAMTGLVTSFNLLGRKGPMSITTDADEYRARFMKMVEGILEEAG